MKTFVTIACAVALVGCGSSEGPADDTSALAPGVEQPRLRPLTCVAPPAQGDPAANSATRAGVERLNCHRDLMGLEPVYLDPVLSAAAQAHADYIAATEEYGHGQSDPGHPLFTGIDARERAEFQGIDIDMSAEALLEVVSFHSDGADPALSVDDWMDSVYHRAPLALPQLSAVGVGSADVFDVMELIAPWEGGDGVTSAVYPGDGMRGVPPSFDSDRESPDPAPDRGVVGYPVTVSFLVAEAGGGTNPYGVWLDYDWIWLDGPDGPVDITILEPESDDFLMRTVALVPHEELLPGSTYFAHVEAEVAGENVVEDWSFTTSR